MSSTNCKIDGFDELTNKLSKMGNIGNTAINRALREAGKVVVAQQQKDGVHRTGAGARELKVGAVKTSRKTNNKYIQVGITKQSNWENVQGIYFQHTGYHNNWNKRYYAGSLWMHQSFKKTKLIAAQVMINTLSKELKL